MAGGPDRYARRARHAAAGAAGAQVPTLYVTTMLVVLTSMSAADPRASYLLQYGLPLAVIAMCAVRLVWWMQRRNDAVDADRARQIAIRTAVMASIICLTASFWTVGTWLDAPPGQRPYHPLFMVVWTLATAFCMSSTRFATVAVLATGIGPVIVALLVAGSGMDHMAATVVLIATMFLLRMNHQQHDQQIDLLRLQKKLFVAASTDPLTGLPNRRALYEALEVALEAPERSGLVLVDLDGFKPVNDAHGHATGDTLLCAVGARLQGACGWSATAFRLGGDEFAIISHRAHEADTQGLATALLGSLATPFAVEGHRIAIGASAGMAHSRRSDSVDSLIARADERLYAAKAMRYADGGERRRTKVLRPSGMRG